MSLKHKPVQSSNIDSVGYDPEKKILELRFKGGGLYAYKGVPQTEHDGLMTSDSIGSYFHANIKNAYKFEKLE